jgi:hypothetical protein
VAAWHVQRVTRHCRPPRILGGRRGCGGSTSLWPCAGFHATWGLAPAEGTRSSMEQADQQHSGGNGGKCGPGRPCVVGPLKEDHGENQCRPSGDEVRNRAVAKGAGVTASRDAAWPPLPWHRVPAGRVSPRQPVGIHQPSHDINDLCPLSLYPSLLRQTQHLRLRLMPEGLAASAQRGQPGRTVCRKISQGQ